MPSLLTTLTKPAPRIKNGVARMPGAIPLFGNIWPLMRRPLAYLDEIRAAGPLTEIRLGPWPAYFVSDYELAKQMLIDDYTQFEKGWAYEIAKPMCGDGVVTLKQREHLPRRRSLQPSFHPDRIADYAKIMQVEAEQRIAGWPAGETFRLDTEVRMLAIRVLAKALFSTDLCEQDAVLVEQAFLQAMWTIGRRMLAPLSFLWKLPTRTNREFPKSCRTLQDVCDRITAIKRARGWAGGKDLLSSLLDAHEEDTGEPLSNLRIQNELVTFMVTGSDTASTSVSWLCTVLGRDPELQEAVRAEVVGVLGGEAPDHTALTRMPLLQQVVNETLRVYPPAWLMTRTTLKDMEFGGTFLPKGTFMLLSIYGIHRDPAIFPNPEEFRPERWASDVRDAIPRGAFLPFGRGRRNCIGEPFALLEIAVVLCTILSKWRIRLAPGTEVRPRPSATLTTSKIEVVLEPLS